MTERTSKSSLYSEPSEILKEKSKDGIYNIKKNKITFTDKDLKHL